MIGTPFPAILEFDIKSGLGDVGGCVNVLTEQRFQKWNPYSVLLVRKHQALAFLQAHSIHGGKPKTKTIYLHRRLLASGSTRAVWRKMTTEAVEHREQLDEDAAHKAVCERNDAVVHEQKLY